MRMRDITPRGTATPTATATVLLFLEEVEVAAAEEDDRVLLSVGDVRLGEDVEWRRSLSVVGAVPALMSGKSGQGSSGSPR